MTSSLCPAICGGGAPRVGRVAKTCARFTRFRFFAGWGRSIFRQTFSLVLSPSCCIFCSCCVTPAPSTLAASSFVACCSLRMCRPCLSFFVVVWTGGTLSSQQSGRRHSSAHGFQPLPEPRVYPGDIKHSPVSRAGTSPASVCVRVCAVPADVFGCSLSSYAIAARCAGCILLSCRASAKSWRLPRACPPRRSEAIDSFEARS